MSVKFPTLPYALDTLEPFISKRTLEFHYGKHHQAYIKKLNELIIGTVYDKMELYDIILNSYQNDQNIFNNASQAWGHDFYWHCMTKSSTHEISSHCLDLIKLNFESLENFKFKFIQSAKNVFGSGWTWLVLNPNGSLSIQNFINADTPLVHEQKPILVCDIWEHAYYLDHQNERNNYLNNFWGIINWSFVEENMNQKIDFIPAISNAEMSY